MRETEIGKNMKKARGQEKRSKSRRKRGRERKKRNRMGNGYKKGE